MNSDKQVKIKGGSAISYHNFVETLVKKFPRFVDLMKQGDKFTKLQVHFDEMAQKLEYCHAAMGIHTEAGEVADILKAHAIYGKDLDRAALVKELGDVRFWVQDIQNKFHISDHEISQGNADKLGERYTGLVYGDKAAIERKDKTYYVSGSIQAITERSDYRGPFEHLYEAEQVTGGLYPHIYQKIDNQYIIIK